MAPRIKIQFVFNATQLRSIMLKIDQFKGPKLRRIVKSGLRKEAQEAVKILKREIPAKFKQARKGIGYSFGRKGQRFTANSTVKVGPKSGKKVSYTEALGAIRRAERKASGKKGVGIGGENLHWPILGTKPRFTKTGHYTGRMRSTMPAFVIKNVSANKSILATAFALGARKQLRKETI